MKLSSDSKESIVEVVKDKDEYLILDGQGSVLARRNENDVEGVRSLKEFTDVLMSNYNWYEI